MTVGCFFPTTSTTIELIPYEEIPYFCPVSNHFDHLYSIQDREEVYEEEDYIFQCFLEERSHFNVLDEIGFVNNAIFQKYRKQVKCIGLEIEYDFRTEKDAFSLEQPLILASQTAKLPVLCKPDGSLYSANGIEINTAPGTVEQVILFLKTLVKNWSVPRGAIHNQTGLHLNIDTSWFSRFKNALLMNWMANNKNINMHLEDYYGRKFDSYGFAYVKDYEELLTFSSVEEVLNDYMEDKNWIYHSIFRYKRNRWEWRSFKSVESISEIEKIFKIFDIFLNLAHQEELFVEDKEHTEQTIIHHLSSLCRL